MHYFRKNTKRAHDNGDKVIHENEQCNINTEATKTSASSSVKIDKYESLKS